MRQLNSIGGSRAETQELAILLGKRKINLRQTLMNQYGSDHADKVMASMEEKRKLKEQEELKMKNLNEHQKVVDAEIKHDLAYQEEIQHQLEVQNSKFK